MRQTSPRVSLVAETRLDLPALRQALEGLGASDWQPGEDATSDAEALIEAAGRRCYRSYAPGLNPNVSRVRTGNRQYLANLIDQRHGSVLEHASATFLFEDVSRVFTHELVRHRAGTAISQESLRYVRLTELRLWTPSCFAADPDQERRAEFERRSRALAEQTEDFLAWVAQAYGLDDPATPFARRKEVTSAMRRWAPEGAATGVLWTANHRSIRWVLEVRTAPAAEEEMRAVFDQVGLICQRRWPHIYQDFTRTADGQWIAGASKI